MAVGFILMLLVLFVSTWKLKCGIFNVRIPGLRRFQNMNLVVFMNLFL